MPRKTTLKEVGETVKSVLHPCDPRFRNKEPKQYLNGQDLTFN